MKLVDDAQVREAIQNLESLIQLRVQFEQRRDQLTSLRNDRALSEMIGAHLDGAKAFWIAFVEVDRFKTINDMFTYENADILLGAIASKLSEMTPCFPRGDAQHAEAFRAHGDEFYLLGELPSESEHVCEAVHRALDQTRQAIAALRIPTSDGRTMSCTVSIGWASISDLEGTVTPRSTLVCLERAVGEAKLAGRDCVRRYGPSFSSHEIITLRSDCGACRSKFSVDMKRDANLRERPLRCPNCGGEVVRPAEPAPTVSSGQGQSIEVGVVHLVAEPEPGRQS